MKIHCGLNRRSKGSATEVIPVCSCGLTEWILPLDERDGIAQCSSVMLRYVNVLAPCLQGPQQEGFNKNATCIWVASDSPSRQDEGQVRLHLTAARCILGVMPEIQV